MSDPKRLTNAELQVRMADYDAQVVGKIISFFERPGMARPAPGLSDADRDGEHEAARIFFSSLEHFMGDLERAAALSDLRRSQLHELRDAILNNMPGKTSWLEAINAARRNW